MIGDRQVNLFVVGAMKAGTTTFVELLRQHPNIYVPPIKEPHFFTDHLPRFVYHPSRFFDLDTYFKKEFPAPLHIAHLSTADQYKQLYALAEDQKYLLDASTAYLASQDAATSIAKYNKDAKIIVTLRDPLQRMYSHYEMALGLGLEKRSFASVVASEVEQYNKHTLSNYTYLGMSLYKAQIESYTSRFDHVLILSFEDLIDNTEALLKEVATFLGIAPFEGTVLQHANVTRKLKGGRWLYFLKRSGIKDLGSKMLGQRTRQRIFRMVSSAEKQEMEISLEMKRQLNAIFEKESHL